MLKTILLALFIIATTNSNAAQPIQPRTNGQLLNAWEPPSGLKQIPIWPNGAPNRLDVHRPPESTLFKTAPDVHPGREYTQILDVSSPTMTVFPPKGVNTGVSMVVFPGGGFRILAIDLEGTEICNWVTAKGITCVLLK